MNRQQKRKDGRETEKIKRRTYTYEECVKITDSVIKQTENQYSVKYTLCLAAALSAEPTNFGKKRVCRVMKLFFDQIEMLGAGVLTDEDIIDVAAKVGVTTRNENDSFVVNIDPRSKKDKTLEIKEITIGGNANDT